MLRIIQRDINQSYCKTTCLFICFFTLVPDDFADDGVYSAVIPRECLRNGRLSTKIYVRGENGTAQVLYDLTGAGSPDSG